jgi:hypothetical protein
MTTCPGRSEAISSCGGAGQNPSVQLKDPLSRRAEHLTAASASAPAFALVSLAVENPSQRRVRARIHYPVATILTLLACRARHTRGARVLREYASAAP